MAPFGLYVVDGMREQLAAAGFELEVHASRACFSESPEAALQRFTREKPAAAWALLNSTAPLQRWFMQQGLPCMLVGARHPGIELPSVATDYYSLGRHAAGHFLRRHHRHLAVLLDSERKAGHASTLAGFQAGCHPVDGAVMRVIRHDSTPQGITSCLTQMLEESPPTGILVAFPRFALAVVSSLACLGVRVPQDISIIARDSDRRPALRAKNQSNRAVGGQRRPRPSPRPTPFAHLRPRSHAGSSAWPPLRRPIICAPRPKPSLPRAKTPLKP